MVSQASETPVKHIIEKARIDGASTKTQMVIAALIIIASGCVAYGSTLKMGFLLDDYLHLDYAARAVAGQFGPLVNNFVSNWGGSDIMKSYRPVISLSIFIDYLLFHTHAFGFHLTNLLAFCTCSVMVAFVTLELTGRLGARSGALTALWAGLLFSVYPLHVESVAWIIGRVDTLATAFYLASLFCFLRLELLREKSFLWGSLAFFLLALTSKEIAVSLPFAVALLACLPPGRLGARSQYSHKAPIGLAQTIGQTLKHAFFASLPYWLMLAAYALFRQTLLGTAVGGYGGAGLTDLFHSLKIFADKESLIKLFVPVSEEFMPVRALAPYCVAPLVAIAGSFLVRQLILYARCEQKLASFLAPLGTVAWLALALVPAFQIWHIYPNLVGSRLFFLSSAGLCITIAMLAVPSIEPMGKKSFSIFSVTALAVLSALYFVWFDALQVNLGAWKQASILVDSFEKQLRKIADSSGQRQIVILNLPQDFKGAGMLGRKLYLDILNRPPFLGADLSSHLTVLEPKITGSRDYIWPSELAQAVAKFGPSSFYIWSNEGSLKHFDTSLAGYASTGADVDLTQAFASSLNSLPSLQAGQWKTIDRDAAVLEKPGSDKDWFEITNCQKYGGDKVINPRSVEVELARGVNPRRPDNRLLTLDVEDEHRVGLTSACKASWLSAGPALNAGEANAYFDSHHGQYLFYLSRYRSYLLSPNLLILKLQFSPGGGNVRFKPGSIKLRSDEDYVPRLTFDAEKAVINWDASQIIKSAGGNAFDEVRIFVIKGGTTIDPNNELDLYRPAALEKATPVLHLPLKGTNGQGSVAIVKLLTVDAQSKHGSIDGPLRQIVAVLASKDGKIVSLPSQPVTIGNLEKPASN
jgi:hypothetical protein